MNNLDNIDPNKLFTGKLTLQLHNAKTGRLENEVQATNFAANQTNLYGAWQQRSAFKAGMNAIGVSDTDYAPHQAANTIVLSDSTLPESPSTEWYMPGKTIGYALKSAYAGTDIMRGTVSSTPLEARTGYTKWVFDWPTHAANGTIASVGWVDSQERYESPIQPSLPSTMTLLSETQVNIGGRYLARASSSQYFVNPRTNLTIYGLDGSFSQTSSFNVNAQFSLVRGIAWDSGNSFLWVIGESSGDKKIAAYSSSGVLQTGPFTLTNRDYDLLASDNNGGLWTLSRNLQNYTAWKIDQSNGSDMTNFSFSIPINPTYLATNTARYSIAGLSWDSTKNLLWTKQFYSSPPNQFPTNIQSWDTSGNNKTIEVGSKAYREAEADYSYDTKGYDPGDFEVDSNRFIIVYPYTASIQRIIVCKSDGLGTRALLPSPIVKTNSQTLKLIYQIDYS